MADNENKPPAAPAEAPLSNPGNVLRVFTEQNEHGQWCAGVVLQPFASKDIALQNAVAMQKAIHEAIIYDLELMAKKNAH